MTLPPEKRPLRGFDRERADQLAQDGALSTRGERSRKRELLNKV